MQNATSVSLSDIGRREHTQQSSIGYTGFQFALSQVQFGIYLTLAYLTHDLCLIADNGRCQLWSADVRVFFVIEVQNEFWNKKNHCSGFEGVEQFVY